MRRILLKVAGLLAVLLIVVLLGAYVAGARMQPDYQGRVEIELQATPDEIYAVLEDFERHPHGGSAVREVRPLAIEAGFGLGADSGPALAAWTEDLGSSQVTVRTVEATAPLRMVREMQDEVLPMSARWELELLPTSRGTKVVLLHSGAIEDGPWQVPLVRLMAKGFGLADQGAQDFLDGLAERLGVEVVDSDVL
ncbi:MAG: SRPBCC family protein [Planctomycetota bacterium]|jgi:hypothetical protein